MKIIGSLIALLFLWCFAVMAWMGIGLVLVILRDVLKLSSLHHWMEKYWLPIGELLAFKKLK